MEPHEAVGRDPREEIVVEDVAKYAEGESGPGREELELHGILP
jgi:hypothetical protein